MFNNIFDFFTGCFPNRRRRKKMLSTVSSEIKQFQPEIKNEDDEKQNTSLGVINSLERHFLFTCDERYEKIAIFLHNPKLPVPYGTRAYIRGLEMYIPRPKPSSSWRKRLGFQKRQENNVLVICSGEKYTCVTCRNHACPYVWTDQERNLKSMSRTDSWIQDNPIDGIHMGSPDEEESERSRRSVIPRRPENYSHIWSFLKHCIGKDLGRISIPVRFCEPISMLQRVTEDLEYSFILDEAANIENSMEQLARVAVFAVSCYGNISRRTGKPFNPLQYETYEFDRMRDLGWRCISEQVSHHPPTLAFHSEGRKWKYWQELTLSTKFKGTSITVVPQGTIHLEFHSGNHYIWKKVTTAVTGLIIGKLQILPFGSIVVDDPKRFRMAKVDFPNPSLNTREITGNVVNEYGTTCWVINGAWDRDLSISKPDSSREKVIWKCNDPLPYGHEIYNFGLFTCQLNEMEPGVAPTDSRLRPDQKLMEQGYLDLAGEAKFKLEEKQRERLRPPKEELPSSSGSPVPTKELPPPFWFKKEFDPFTTETMYIYSGLYWEMKDHGDWSRCPQIFDY